MEATRKSNSDTVAAGIAPVVDRVATSAHEAVDKAASAATAAARVIEKKGEQLRDIAEKRGEQLKDLQARYLDGCRDQVRDNPIAAIGVAVVAGFLLAQFLTRR